MNNDNFEYSYKAPTESERREIESIRRQYMEKPVDDKEEKLKRLRKLDSFVKNSAVVTGLVLGVVGTLIFGLGMTMILEWSIFVWGVIICAVGLTPIFIAYPVYNLILNHNKVKYSQEILDLSEELLRDENKINM